MGRAHDAITTGRFWTSRDLARPRLQGGWHPCVWGQGGAFYTFLAAGRTESIDPGKLALPHHFLPIFCIVAVTPTCGGQQHEPSALIISIRSSAAFFLLA